MDQKRGIRIALFHILNCRAERKEECEIVGKHAKTEALLQVALEVLQANNPMTVRQVYYQLVSRQVIKNNRSQYQAVSNALVEARKDGTIPWEWIEDRLRRPRRVSMWNGLPDFADTARRAYRRNVWGSQPAYVEMWLEKDAISGIFEDALNRYGVTLNVGRGYDGWDSIHNAACRFLNKSEKGVHSTVLYFGDFDPSGEDMVRSLKERLEQLGAAPDIRKCALSPDDVERYQLPPDFAKKTDSRSARFIAKHGDISVELDALPLDVLRSRIVEEVEQCLDLKALENVRRMEERDRQRLIRALARMR
jgi:hypothetical protein